MSGEIIPLAEEAFDLMGKNLDCAGETVLFIFDPYAYASLLIDHVTMRTDTLFGHLQKSDGRLLEGRSSRSQAVGLEKTQLNRDGNNLSPNSVRDPDRPTHYNQGLAGQDGSFQWSRAAELKSTTAGFRVDP
ncbi:hypothetical protein DFH09DRAFT_1101020 [Mycena vulgaris]|nr:hypothetical protein DFH09DRAFT_1101020 [Mycena vulgaris]